MELLILYSYILRYILDALRLQELLIMNMEDPELELGALSWWLGEDFFFEQ